MSSESSRKRLPFEPQTKKTKSNPKSSVTEGKAKKQAKTSSQKQGDPMNSPDVVSKRMARRMAVFCGIPTGLGMSSFFIFYWLVQKGWWEFPTITVVFISLGLFGLGVVGLTYGLLSASWEEERVGSWFGLEEFKINFGRMTTAWNAARAAKKDS
jgi:uncharacterized ion transporter superfamily protein YfcC